MFDGRVWDEARGRGSLRFRRFGRVARDRFRWRGPDFPIMQWGGVDVLHVLLQPVLPLLDVFVHSDAVHQLDLADGPPAVQETSENRI